MKFLNHIFVGSLVAAGCVVGNAEDRRFEFQEHFGHAWETDLVSRAFTVAPEEGWRQESLRLLLDGKPVPMQIDRARTLNDGTLTGGEAWFMMDLPANSARTFVLRFAPGTLAPQPDAPVVVKQEGSVLTLDNGLAAIRIPACAWDAPGEADRGDACSQLAAHLGATCLDEAAPGPILGLRLASGRWTGQSRVRPFEKLSPFIKYAPQELFQNVDAKDPAGRFLGYRTEIEVRGPLVARASVTYSFENDGEYTITVEVRSGEPLVRIGERYSNAGVLALDMGDHAPNAAHTILGIQDRTRGKTTPLTYESNVPRAFFVVYNYYFPDVGMAFALTGDPSGDITGLVATDPDWLPYPYNQVIHLVTEPGPKLTLRANLHDGHRDWAFLAAGPDFLARGDEVAPAAAFIDWWHRRVAFSLSKVSGWTVEWEGGAESGYPHLLFDEAELPAIRERLTGHPFVDAAMKKATGNDHGRFVAAAFYLATGERAYLERLRKEDPFSYINQCASAILEKRGLNFTPLSGNLNQTDDLSIRLVAMDLLLGSDLMSSEEKADELRKLALLTYYLHDHHWLPPQYAFDAVGGAYPGYVQGTPNMKTCFSFIKAMLACLLKGHPAQQEWIQEAIEDNDRVMPVSVHESGALLESPFYSSRDTMRWGPFWTALARKGGALPLRLMVSGGRIASGGFVVETAGTAALVYDGATAIVNADDPENTAVRTPDQVKYFFK